MLGEALLDQTVVAGMGTIWLAEACFTHGVHPLGPVAQVGDPTRFLGRVRAMLQLAVEQGRPVTTGDRRAPLWHCHRGGAGRTRGAGADDVLVPTVPTVRLTLIQAPRRAAFAERSW